MPKQMLQIVSNNSTLANFKSWAQAISNWFATCGWTKSADTGQVDWSTIAAVPSSTTVYEIWQPSDGGTPYYLKVEYGYSTTQIQMYFTLGTGTNGAGTLIGFVTPQMRAYADGNSYKSNDSATTLRECVFYGTNGSIGIMMWRNSPTWNSFSFFIERTLNNSGTPTSDGVAMWAFGDCNNLQNWGARQHILIFGKGAWYPSSYGDGQYGCLCAASLVHGSDSADNGTTGAFQGNLPTYPIFPIAGKLYPPTRMFVFGNLDDWVSGLLYTFKDFYDTSHTWFCNAEGVYAGLTPSMPSCLLMRYED